MWIILGVIIGLVVITAIGVPTTVVLTAKTKETTTKTMNTTDEISSTIKGPYFFLKVFSEYSID
jgi:hypothetical protein